MFKKITISATLAILCLGLVMIIWKPPIPRLIYNPSPSAPMGWYIVNPKGKIKTDTFVAAFAPKTARELASKRQYLPNNVPLLKTVWAVEGAQFCATNGIIRTKNRPDIIAQSHDSMGRDMPQLEGCFTLQTGQVFLISTDVPNSFDSRYFGPVTASNVLGTVKYLGKFSDLWIYWA